MSAELLAFRPVALPRDHRSSLVALSLSDRWRRTMGNLLPSVDPPKLDAAAAPFLEATPANKVTLGRRTRKKA